MADIETERLIMREISEESNDQELKETWEDDSVFMAESDCAYAKTLNELKLLTLNLREELYGDANEFAKLLETKYAADYLTNCDYDFPLRLKDTGKIIGVVIFANTIRESQMPAVHAGEDGNCDFELRVWIDASYRNKGYATEAIDALLPYVRDAYGARDIWCAAETTSEAALKVIERCGFEEMFSCTEIPVEASEKTSTIRCFWKAEERWQLMCMFETEHLYLTHWIERDRFESWGLPLELGNEYNTTIDRVLEMIDRDSIEQENNAFAIMRKPDKSLVGCAKIFDGFGDKELISDAPFVGNDWVAHDNPYCKHERLSHAEIKCWILPEFRNLGYATEVIKELCRHAFIDKRSITTLWVRAECEEVAALKVAKKCGFSDEVIRVVISNADPNDPHTTRFLTLKKSAWKDQM